MDQREARLVLSREMDALRKLSYEELRARIPRVRRRILFIELVDGPECVTHRVTGESGTVYQVETQVFWDSRSGPARFGSALDG